MYRRSKLTDNKLQELKDLIETAELSNEEEIEKLKKTNPTLIKYNYDGLGGYATGARSKHDFYSPVRNLELVKFIRENIIRVYDSEIVSIHINTYKETSGAPEHKDLNSLRTYLVLLEPAEAGGDLIIEKQNTNFQVGEIIDFCGHRTYHQVTKVEKGTRRTFTAFCNEPTAVI